MAHGSPVTAEHKARFLRLLRDTGSVRVSAEGVGYTRETMKRQRALDDEFDALWQEAEDDAADALESEARRRAVKGVKRERYVGTKDNGHFVTERHYSDTLLVKLLEANNPSKFMNRSKTEISNPDGSLAPQVGDTELAARLSSLLAIAAARMTEGDAK